MGLGRGSKAGGGGAGWAGPGAGGPWGRMGLAGGEEGGGRMGSAWPKEKWRQVRAAQGRRSGWWW